MRVRFENGLAHGCMSVGVRRTDLNAINGRSLSERVSIQDAVLHGLCGHVRERVRLLCRPGLHGSLRRGFKSPGMRRMMGLGF